MKTQLGEKCPKCSGTGKREYDHMTPRGTVIQIEAMCDGCEGSGLAKDYKPAVCPKHPDGLVEHTWDLTQTVMNGLPSGEGVKSNHRYHCHDCGQELAGINRERRIADEITRMAYEAVRDRQNKANGW